MINEFETVCVILAAGEGKRMKSEKSKVCCEVLGKPMLTWVIDACHKLGLADDELCVVISDKPNGVREILPSGINIAIQKEKLGTGHAVMQSLDFLKEKYSQGYKYACILYGDVPFVDADVLKAFFSTHKRAGNDVTDLTAKLDDPRQYGRIIHEKSGNIRILEWADATEEERKINEINSGIYYYNLSYLIDSLPKLKNDNAQKEYYLTDTVGMAKKSGSYVSPDVDVVLGANSPEELEKLNLIAKTKFNI